MALQKQIVEIPVDGGLDTKTDPILSKIGASLVLENARFQKTGRLTKRYGNTALTVNSDGSDIDDISPSRIISDDNQINAITTDGIYSYFEGGTEWTNISPFTYGAKVESEFISKNSYNQVNPDCDIDTTSGVMATVFGGNFTGLTNKIFIVSEDLATGTKKVTEFLNATSSNQQRQRLVIVNNSGNPRILVFYATFTDILLRVYDKFLNLISGPTSIAAWTAQTQFDVCKDTTHVYLTRIVSTTLDFYKFDQTGAQVLNVATTVPTAISTRGGGNATGISTFADSTTLHVSYSYTGEFVAIGGFSKVFVNTVSWFDTATTGTKIGLYSNGSNVFLAFSYDNSSDYQDSEVVFWELSYTGTYSTVATVGFSRYTLLSNPFTYNSKVYVPIQMNESQDESGFLFDFESGYPVCKFSPGQVEPNRSISAAASAEYMISKSVVYNNKAYTSLERTFKLNTNEEFTDVFDPTVAITKSIFDLKSDYTSGTRCKVGDSIYYTDGMTVELDGRRPHENGFLNTPRIDSVAAVNGVANPNVASKTFNYCVTYEFYDGKGQITRSRPSAAVSVTTGASAQSITVTFCEPSRSLKQSGAIAMAAVIWRTTNNGTTFYRLATDPGINNSGGTDSYSDTTADSTIQNNEVLYTTGGVLDNDPAPVAKFSTSGGNRLFLGGLEERDEIAYSKKQLFGESVNFSDFFRIRVSFGTSSDNSKISALGYMDGKLIIFREGSIYYIAGDGPNELGLQNDFTEPEIVSADCGCSEPRSVVNTAEGIMFKSTKGIYLLTRGLQTVYIGAEVEDFNGEKIVASVNIGNLSEVRFYTDQGNCLTYNDVFKKWSVATDQTTKDADVYRGYTCQIGQSNKILYEDTTSFQDDGAYYPMKLVTSWIKFAQIQGFQRFYRLGIIGNYYTAHDLIVNSYYDYDDSYNDTYTLTYDNTDQPNYQFDIGLARQKVEAIKFEIYDDNIAGESYSLSNLQLYVGIKPGQFKLPENKRF